MLAASRVGRRLRLPATAAVCFVVLAVAGVTGVAYAAITTVQGSSAGANAIAQTIRAGELEVAGSFLLVPTPEPGPNGTADEALGGFPTEGPTFGILTTGSAALADDPNNAPNSGVSLGGGPRTEGGSDRDVTILRIDFTAPAGSNCVGFDFKFLSEEFPEFVGSAFNDAFIAELDVSNWSTQGSQITAPNNFAFDPDGRPISVNSTGPTSLTPANAAGTTYDGATTVLRASTQLTPGEHSLYLSIFDQGDTVLDSAVFLDNLVVGFVPDPDADCVEGAQSPARATIELASGEPTVIAGAQRVPISGIDAADLQQTVGGTTESTPLDAIPLDAIDLSQTPLDAIPLDAIGLTSQLLNAALGGVHLSDVPLSTPGGWEAELAGTALAGVPLNTITLADVYALNEASDPDAIPLDAIPLDAIDLSETPLDAIGLAAVALGATPLDAIPLDAIGANDPVENAADWCALINSIEGYSCPPIDPTTDTLIGIAVKGLPLDAIPLDAIPLDAIAPGSVPLDAIPLDAIPLDAISTVGSPLDAIPLDAIDFAVSPLDAIPLDAIGAGIIDCSGGYCTPPPARTLGDADADGRILPSATLGDLIDALLPGHGASVADLIHGLPSPPELTLGDLFALLLGAEAAYDWSALDLAKFPIALHSPDGGDISYSATFEITGGVSPTDATIHASLPDGGLYKAGSTQLIRADTGASVPLGEPTVGASQLEWTPEVEEGVVYRLSWQVHAPIELGNYAISANVIVPGMEAPESSAPVGVEVIQTLEPNDTPGAGPLLESDTLYLSYMLRGDVDRYVVPIPPAFGSKVRITLSHIAEGTDLDLTVSGPSAPPLREAPANSIPLQNAQLFDTELALDQRSQALPPEALQDVPTDAITTGSNVVRATSDNRGSADEEVTLISQGETGQYIVQVSDYRGDSALPYMLEVEVTGPPELGACAPRSFPSLGQGTLGTIPSSLPANVNTLILVNQKRLGDSYGTTAMNNVMAKLNELAGRADLGIVGAVVPVDGDAGVRAAYNGWDANPCSPQTANAVVGEIGRVIDTLEPATLRYKVIVGGDDQVPFARVPDETLIANESTYVDTLTGPNSQYKGAFGYGFLMTDDVYAEEAAPQLFGHELFVPDQAVGRVLETPGEITGLIDAFLAADGAVAPQRSLVTGYDFLTDGSNAVNSPFAAAFGANAQTLINETWVAKDPASGDIANDLEDALFPPANAPQLNSINAHFDHTRLLPAAENAANLATNLYVSQDVRDRGAAAVAERLFFSMGCHSGLSISDVIYGAGSPLAKDWAQTFLAGGAFAWIGNTGYGLGDTVEVAYTERLHALFSGNLDGSLTLGEALAQAKQEYLSQLGIIGGYDAKVVMQATLLGLPMLKVGTGQPPANPPPLPTQTDPATGLEAAPFNVNPSFTPVNTPDGRFYRAQTTQTTNRRPIEPALNFDVTQPGKVAHGIVITSLQSPADEENFDAAFSRIVTDKSEDEPELVGEASYPAKIQSLSTFSSFTSPTVTRQNAVLIAGLYRSDGVPDPLGVGIHRLYNQIGGYVLYANPGVTDFTAPELGALETQTIGSGVGFAVSVTDAAGTVEDVRVIYRDCGGTWRLSTLQPSGPNRWSGGGAVAPAGCSQIDYYLQAVDNAGNVALSSKKVQIEPLVLPPPTGNTDIVIDIEIDPPGTQHPSGWYTGAVDVTITPSSVEYSLDGSPFQPYAGFTVGGDGVHIVEARAEDGSTATAGFAIDTTAPVVLMTTPPAGAVYELGQVVKAEFTCADAGSGPATCSGAPANGAALDTSSLGTKTITGTATDLVGNSTTFSRTYEVVQREILFVKGGDIWAVNPAGGAPVRLTSGPTIDAEPDWFPGGEKIVFSSTRGPDVDLFAMDDDGANIDQLTSHRAIDLSPAVSPDGTKIAFSSNRASPLNFDIHLLDIATGNVTRLTTHSSLDTLPAWSPDGTQIVFSSFRTGNGDIYKLNVSNPASTQVRLTSGSTANGVDTEPAWHGSTIAFSTNRHGFLNFEIYTMNTSGGQQTRRTNNAAADVTPSWRGDGAKIAFASNRSSQPLNFNIWTMNPDGSSQTALVTGPTAETFPDW